MQLARQAIEGGADLLVVVGGDGSVNEVVNGLMRAREEGATPTAFGVIPAATGNDFARSIGMPLKKRDAILALLKAKSRPLDIGRVDYVNAHGTATPLNDREETLAMKQVFGSDAKRLAISSTKSMLGHPLGASAAIELALTALAVHQQVAPPTINYETPDPDCDLDYVPGQARPMAIDVALSNSMGFGGHDSTIALGRWPTP